MKVSKELAKTLQFDPVKTDQLFTDLVEVFQKAHPTIGEILIAYGNLGYTLGAGMEGFKEKGPALDEVKDLYYKKPTLGVAMMMQALEVLSWYEQYSKMMTGETTPKEEPKV